MSKPNLLRHPFGVSMTTFKLPDLASNGGNLLSRFICILRIRSCRDNRAQMRNVSTATILSWRHPERVALSVAILARPHRGRDQASRGAFDGLLTSHRFSFSKKNFLGTTDIG